MIGTMADEGSVATTDGSMVGGVHRSTCWMSSPSPSRTAISSALKYAPTFMDCNTAAGVMSSARSVGSNVIVESRP